MNPLLPAGRPVSHALALAAASCALSLAGAARANSPPAPLSRCDVEIVGPVTDYEFVGRAKTASVPANLPSFFATSNRGPLPPIRLLDLSTEPPREVPLRFEQRLGEVDPDGFTIETYALVPSAAGPAIDGAPAALVAGHDYRFEFVRTCYAPYKPNEIISTTEAKSFTLRATPAVPLPSSLGTLTQGGLYFSPNSETFARPSEYTLHLAFTPARDVLPWADVYYEERIYNDTAPDRSGPRANGLDSGLSLGTSLAYAESNGDSAIITPLAVACRSATPGVTTTERHTFQSVARPLGFDAEPIVTNTLEVDLECSLDPPTNASSNDASAAREGCVVASPGRPSAWAAWAAGALLALAGLIARRRSR